ncbi:MAG: DUF2249 domain-containing protein [Gammaproteobacteria bacterium]|nr:DUF2249 domain-containing protein [Gammaproteobacteria bacterium]
MARQVLLDVSDMEPPDPLVMATEAVSQLQPGEYLCLRHRRDPCLLYEQLQQSGFGFRQRQGSVTAVELLVWRVGDTEAEAAVVAEFDE